MIRSINKVLRAVEKREGLGIKVFRSIGNLPVKRFNPFLLFDHFEAGEKSGFPPHPHMGHETITLVLNGGIAHEDFTGSSGIIQKGDLQFMTAGKGIVHSEMIAPSFDGSLTSGIQIWVDLPERFKETKPNYRDLKSEEIPEVNEQNGKLRVRVISGKSYGVGSLRELAYTPIHYYHITMKPGAKFLQTFPKDFNFFLYVIRGNGLLVNDKIINAYETCLFNRDGDVISCKTACELNSDDTDKDVEFVLVGGQILEQKVNRFGTFVATSQSRVQTGLDDYAHCRNGFENLKTWKSSIKQ